MIGAAFPLLVLTLGALGAGAYFMGRREDGTPSSSGLAPNFTTAATPAEAEQVRQKLMTRERPIVFIVFKPGQVPFEAIQSAAMAQARAYPQIWVVVMTHDAAVSIGGQGVLQSCGPSDGGVVKSAPWGGGEGSETYIACWPANSTSDVVVKQTINIAAITAKNMAAVA